MPRPDKVAVVDEVRERLEGSAATLLTEYRGLTVSQLAQLRARLREAGGEYKVVKNTLTAIAAKDAGYDVPAELLAGPTAVTFAAEDPAAVAKVLREFAKANPSLVVKGGILEGKVLNAAEAGQLADLPSRDELLATAAGMMQSLVAQPARLALASLSKVARLFAALQDKKEAAGETASAPAVEEPAAAAEEPAAAADEPAAAGDGAATDEVPAEADAAADTTEA